MAATKVSATIVQIPGVDISSRLRASPRVVSRTRFSRPRSWRASTLRAASSASAMAPSVGWASTSSRTFPRGDQRNCRRPLSISINSTTSCLPPCRLRFLTENTVIRAGNRPFVDATGRLQVRENKFLGHRHRREESTEQKSKNRGQQRQDAPLHCCPTLIPQERRRSPVSALPEAALRSATPRRSRGSRRQWRRRTSPSG